MSTTTITTPTPAATTSTTQVTTTAPELTIVSRVASIPLVASSLETLDSTLSSNAYLRSPYHTAKALSQSAYTYTTPIQQRLAPLIVRADDFANKGLDAVQARYPYPFNASPEEVANYVREQQKSAFDVANRTIDQRVVTPAYGVAQGIDQRFAPVVDYFEVAVNKLNSTNPSSSVSASISPNGNAQFQYQRAYGISKHLRDNLYVYSNEHLKQLQEQSVLVQRATATAQSITQLAASSLSSAQARVYALSNSMILELQRVQSAIAQLPEALRSTMNSGSSSQTGGAETELGKAIATLRGMLSAGEGAVNERATRIGAEVRETVWPILEGVQQRVGELVGVLGAKKDAAKEEAANGVGEARAQMNGNGKT